MFNHAPMLPFPAARTRTEFSGNQQTTDNPLVSILMPGHSTGSLSVAGWSYSHNRAEFYRPAVSGWALENTGGDFVLYPAGDYQTRQVRFRNDGNVLFPKTVTIGNVGPTGTGTLALAVGGSVGARAVYVRAPGVAWPGPTTCLRPPTGCGPWARWPASFRPTVTCPTCPRPPTCRPRAWTWAAWMRCC